MTWELVFQLVVLMGFATLCAGLLIGAVKVPAKEKQ